MESQFWREGAGNDLYYAGLPEATTLQNVYVGHICNQAGISCGDLAVEPTDWALFVQGGLNDIDQRCDAYLSWLDNKRRWQNPILKQLGDTSVAAQGIMRVTGVSANPITIVGLAFGLASDTFTNVNSRLVLEVNHSTVQSVVFRRQADYRRELMGTRIDNRPAAIHALRSYLRICMPFTIEMEINTTVTTFERGGPGALVDRHPLITPRTIGPAVTRPVVRERIITDVRAPAAAPTTKIKREAPGGAKTADERETFSQEVSEFQTSLCVEPDGRFGDAGPPPSTTRLAFFNYLAGRNRLPLGATPSTLTFTKAVRDLLAEAVRQVPDCRAAGYLNAYEVGRYGIASTPQLRAIRVNNLRGRLRELLSRTATDLPDISTDKVDDRTRLFDEKLRQAIQDFREKMKPQLASGRFVDADFIKLVFD